MQSDFLVQFVTNLLPVKRKSSSKGWTSFNAPCCTHNGESTDKRGRGGIICNADGGISYHCFNCQYKTGWQPGRPVSYKFRKLLSWLGASENDIRQLVIEAIRVKEFIALTNPEQAKDTEPVSYKVRPLPAQAQTLNAWAKFYSESDNCPNELLEAINYVHQRAIDLDRYEFYWTPEVEHKLSHRVIIPLTWQNECIGYSARALVNGIKPKYHSQHEPDFVFNTDQQRAENKFVIVAEGQFDAMSVDGVAVMSSECSERQADIIDSLAKEVVVVPDFDIKINPNTGKKVWAGSKLIEQAIEFGWSVSFPVWREDCKDINEAVIKYGKLFVLKTILDSKEHNRLKIELMKRKVYNG